MGYPTSWRLDRKSTRLNSSHVKISYAVFCLKKKKKSWGSPAPAYPPRGSPARLSGAHSPLRPQELRPLLSTAVASLPFVFFLSNDTANTDIYTLSLHDALPI